MSDENFTTQPEHSDETHAKRLFTGSCFALIATAVAFATVGAIMGDLKSQFVLTNAQVGLIGGAALWGFTISIFIFGPLCDALGMKLLLRLAFISHAVGALVMIFAEPLSGMLGGAFTTLFIGALIIALGNGLVEAACNPLVATIYPLEKTKKLNQFHVWFPGGIALGGVAAYLLDKTPVGTWQMKLALILIPTAIYGFLFLNQKFPPTERLQSGVSFGDMFKATLLRPLFLVLFFCMMLTASLELGPNRWVPAVLESGGIPGILVLVWINLLMALLRYYAGHAVERLAPTGILLVCAILSGIGLFWLSFVTTAGMAFAAGTVFAVGVCYFWPTMLGVTAERVPRGGALALALMGGIGMAIVGLVTTPVMGEMADQYGHSEFPVADTAQCVEQIVKVYPAPSNPEEMTDAEAAHADAADVLAYYKKNNALPPIDTANALRAAINAGAEGETGQAVVDQANALVNAADNYGGRMAFRRVAPLSIILIVIFGILWIRDRAAGGYKAEKIQ